MRLSSWLRSARSLFVPSGTEKGHRPTRLRKRAMAAQLSVERLEDRTVPSTFTVLNLADSGPGSLRQAILDANANPGADLIRFAPAARDGTIALTERGVEHHGRPDRSTAPAPAGWPSAATTPAGSSGSAAAWR